MNSVFRTLERNENIALKQWDEFFMVVSSDSMTAESCKEFVYRVLFHRHIGNNTHLPLGGSDEEGCFINDREAAEVWFRFLTEGET